MVNKLIEQLDQVLTLKVADHPNYRTTAMLVNSLQLVGFTKELAWKTAVRVRINVSHAAIHDPAFIQVIDKTASIISHINFQIMKDIDKAKDDYSQYDEEIFLQYITRIKIDCRKDHEKKI